MSVQRDPIHQTLRPLVAVPGQAMREPLRGQPLGGLVSVPKTGFHQSLAQHVITSVHVLSDDPINMGRHMRLNIVHLHLPSKALAIRSKARVSWLLLSAWAGLEQSPKWRPKRNANATHPQRSFFVMMAPYHASLLGDKLWSVREQIKNPRRLGGEEASEGPMRRRPPCVAYATSILWTVNPGGFGLQHSHGVQFLHRQPGQIKPVLGVNVLCAFTMNQSLQGDRGFHHLCHILG